MIEYLLAFVALIASLPVAAIAYDLTGFLYEDWHKPLAVNKVTGLVVASSLWIVAGYSCTYALFVLFGGEA